MSSLIPSAMAYLKELLLPHAPLITKTFVALFLLANLKSIPPVWHIRYLSTLFINTILLPHRPPPKRHLFSPLHSKTYCNFLEYDINGHKSNSTYFMDIDIITTQLVSRLGRKSFGDGAKEGKLVFPRLGAVSCNFRREIKLWQRYNIFSRVISWDEKWVYAVTHFVEAGGKKRVFASALSKFVFKHGRITIPPSQVWVEGKIMPEPPAHVTESGEAEEERKPDEEGLKVMPEKLMEAAEELVTKDALETVTKSEKPEEDTGEWTWERIEKERRRGMKIVGALLSMDELEKEWRDGSEEGLERVRKWF